MKHRLGAEAAADIGRDDAQLMFQETERLHHHGLGAMRRLRAVPNRQQIFVRLVARDHAARLDREAAAFLHAKPLGKPVRRRGENAIHFAVIDNVLGGQIVGAIEPRPRRAGGKAVARIGHDRQVVVVDFDQRRRIFRGAAVVGNDKRDRLADIADLVAGETSGLGVEFDRRRGERERNPVAGQKRPQVGI